MSNHHLLQLQQLRAFVWLAQALTLFFAYDYLHRSQFYTLGILLALEMVLLIFTHWRVLHLLRSSAIVMRDQELFIQLLMDCLLLTAVLYVAGGATNPFVSYYLVPIALSAATLPRLYVVSLAGICLLAYSTLLFFYQPLQVLSPHEHHHGNSDLSLHVLGMWLNFGISALLITHFVVAMANTVRRQKERINQMRERQLMDENIMAVATLAAGTAHELGTPLSSVAIVLGDLLAEKSGADIAPELQLMREQVSRCQQSLQRLASTARQHQLGGGESMPVNQFIEQLMQRWQVLRPEKPFVLDVQGGADVMGVFPLTLEQALINLFNNAADAAKQHLSLRIGWNEEQLSIDVEDDGPGVDSDVLEQRRHMKDSERGMGLGLLLSHATLERAGGSIGLEPRVGGGTVTHIRVPIGWDAGRSEFSA